MPANFGRRLVPVSTLLVGLVLVAIVTGISLFAFGAFVGHVNLAARELGSEAAALAAGSHRPRDARRVAGALAPLLIEPALLATFVDAEERATVLRVSDVRGRGRTAVLVRSRADRSAEPQASGTFARFALGLATVFGLKTFRFHQNLLEFYVAPNQHTFVSDVRGYAPAFSVAILVAMLLAVTAARVLTGEALRPLEQVTAALERFASGDFTPDHVRTEGNYQLGALARAYNGAVTQVERSFAERTRANAAMQQFIADAGHELRTPLTVIRGFVGILRRDGFASEAELAHILESMAQQTALMSSLIEKLMLLERWEQSSFDDAKAPFDVGEMIAEAVTPLALANPDRDLQIAAEQGTWAITDADDFHHALTNIVDNALKYTPGAVDVELSASPGEVCVTVRDRGPGLEPDQIPRVFDRFYRGRRRDVEGSGLGLSIAKRATERAGGRVDLTSTVDEGTTVRLYFPRCAPLAVSANDRR